MNRWWSCCRKLLAACTPGFGSWQDHSPSVTLRFSCWLARSRIGHRKKRVLTLGRGNQYPLQGGGPMHVWSAPASRRMFAARCLTTYYYVRGLHAESFRAFLSFSSSSHFTDAAVELRALPLPGGFAAFFAHLREVVCAILRHVGRAALSSDGAVVFTATFFFKRCSSLFSDTSIIIFAILIADCASPPTARFGC